MAYYSDRTIVRTGQYKIITEATANPVSLTDLKGHLNIFDTAEDTYLGEILLASQQVVSQFLGEFVSPTTCRADVDNWNDVVLPQRHVASITSIQYYDNTNALQTLASSNYIFDDSAEDASVVFLDNQKPELSRYYRYPVRITYVANLPTTPDAVRQAIRIVAGEMYQSRSLSTDNNVQRLPLQVEYLLAGIRRY